MRSRREPLMILALARSEDVIEKMMEGRIEFKDLMGSMMNLSDMNFDEDLTEDDFQ